MEANPEVKNINRQIFRLISDITVKLRSRLGRRTLDEKSQLNILEYIILRKVSRGSVSMKQIRNDLGLHKAYFSQISRDLLDTGYIDMNYEKDRRYKILSITRKGKRELEKQDEYRFAQFNEILGDLSSVEKDKFLVSLKNIQTILNKFK